MVVAGVVIRNLTDEGREGTLHVPRLKEHVLVKDTMYKVVRVTSIIGTDFTTVPLVRVDLKESNW
jgi:hypothetical protein